MERIALIAHDNMKDEIVTFVKENLDFFKNFELVATGTTGKRIAEATGLNIHRYQSGPIGGDQQIGADIALNKIKAVFFLIFGKVSTILYSKGLLCFVSVERDILLSKEFIS